MHGSVWEFYPRHALPLPPPALPVMPAQAPQFANGGTNGNCFNAGDGSEGPEIHAVRVLGLSREVKPRSIEVRLSCGPERPQAT